MFETFLIKPLYNGFIYLIGVMPSGDVGFAIIALTVVIRAVFYPAFAASIRTQMGMQAAQAELDEINKKYKDNAEERARQTLALYKEKKIRPFASLLALLVQLPIFIALYYALFREGLPHIAQELLYPFVHVPQTVNVSFLGVIDLLHTHNIVLTIIVAGLQYLVAYISVSRIRTSSTGLPKEKQVAQQMQQNMMLCGRFVASSNAVCHSRPRPWPLLEMHRPSVGQSSGFEISACLISESKRHSSREETSSVIGSSMRVSERSHRFSVGHTPPGTSSRRFACSVAKARFPKHVVPWERSTSCVMPEVICHPVSIGETSLSEISSRMNCPPSLVRWNRILSGLRPCRSVSGSSS
jgi:YidC/Oxa1 family membrane protein insertase